MQTKQRLSVPSLDQVKKELAAANAEVRFLRRLAKLAREREEAEHLRAQAAREGGEQ